MPLIFGYLINCIIIIIIIETYTISGKEKLFTQN